MNLCILSPSLLAHVSISLLLSTRHCSLGCTHPLWLLQPFHLLLLFTLSLDRSLMKTSLLGLNTKVFLPLSLWKFFRCGSHCYFQYTARRILSAEDWVRHRYVYWYSDMISSDIEYSDVSLRFVLLLCSFERLVVAESRGSWLITFEWNSDLWV